MRRLLAHLCCSLLLVFAFSVRLSAEELPNTTQELAEQIDALMRQKFDEVELTPAPLVNRTTDFRRLSLVLAGRIPTVSEVRSLVDSPTPPSRQELIEQLMNEPGYVNTLVRWWRFTLIPRNDLEPQVQNRMAGLYEWLRDQVLTHATADEIVSQLLATPQNQAALQAGNGNQIRPDATVDAYFQAYALESPQLATAAARSFLGQRIDCAQCHDDPFEPWTQDDFWQFTALFDQLPPGPSEASLQANTGTITIPETDRVVKGRYLNATEELPDLGQSRQQLARWLVSADNPYFAKTMANRVWGHVFGRGLIDPLDDLGTTNSTDHPQVLQLISKTLVAWDYDLDRLIEALVLTEAFQRSSSWEGDDPPADSLFAKAVIRPMSGEQLWSSLGIAIGYTTPLSNRELTGFVVGQNDAMSDFFTKFTSGPVRMRDAEATIQQALQMMNGEMVARSTTFGPLSSAGGNRMERPAGPRPQNYEAMLLLGVLSFPGFDTSQRLDVLYYSTLSRKPEAEERERFLDYLNQAESERSSAWTDIYWVLLNSAEFRFIY